MKTLRSSRTRIISLGFTPMQDAMSVSKQLSLLPQADETLRSELMQIDPERLTPFDALLKLKELVEKARGNG